MRISFTGLIALLALMGVAPRAWAATEADAWLGSGPARVKLFDSYVTDIRDGAPNADAASRRLGSSWEKELARTRRRFLEAKTKDDAYYALVSLKNTLHDGHGGLEAPEELKPEQARYRGPLRFRPELADGKLRFVVSFSTVADARAGLVLTGVDGKSVERAMDEYREWQRTSSPEHMAYEFAHWLSTRYSYDAPLPVPLRVSYDLRDPATGKTETRAYGLSRHGYDFDQEDPLSSTRYPVSEDYTDWTPAFQGLNYRVYEDGAAAIVVRFTSFNYRFSSWELWQRVADLSYKPRKLERRGDETSSLLEEQDMDALEAYLRGADPRDKRLLVDVRENGGGSIADRLLGLLASGDFKETTNRWLYTPLLRRDPTFLDEVLRMAPSSRVEMIRRQIAAGEKESPVFSFTCATEECGASEAVGKARSLGRRYSPALLSGPHCVSSCDQFVSIFADNRMGPVFGLPSQGESSPARGARRFTLANGRHFNLILSTGRTYRANGQVLEGNPAGPAKPEYPTPGYLRRLLATPW